jgi:hypothetical protein
VTSHYCDKKDNKTEARIAAKHVIPAPTGKRKEKQKGEEHPVAQPSSGCMFGFPRRNTWATRFAFSRRRGVTILAAVSGLVAVTAAGDRTLVYRRLSMFVCYAKNHIPLEIFRLRLSEAVMLPTHTSIPTPISKA